jgi:hypothetical protein
LRDCKCKFSAVIVKSFFIFFWEKKENLKRCEFIASKHPCAKGKNRSDAEKDLPSRVSLPKVGDSAWGQTA